MSIKEGPVTRFLHIHRGCFGYGSPEGHARVSVYRDGDQRPCSVADAVVANNLNGEVSCLSHVVS
jgi:hypothetical protein